MRKGLLLSFLCLLFNFNIQAERFVVENYFGINCVQYTVKQDQSFYEVAQQFFIRPSTLVLVNNVKDVNEVAEGKLMYIPLTETNFYTSAALNSSSVLFSPVVYQTNEEKSWQDVGDQFFVSTTLLSSWNKNQSFEVFQNKKIMVGWLKHKANLTLEETPRFVQREKIVYGTKEEKEEAKREMNKVASLAKNVQPDFKNHTIPQAALPEVEEPANENLQQDVKISGNKEVVKKSKREKKLVLSKLKKEKKVVVSKPKVEKEVAQVEVIEKRPSDLTEKEKAFLETNKTTKEKKGKSKKSGLLNKVKALTQNSYNRDKARLKSSETAKAKSEKNTKPIVTLRTKTKEKVRKEEDVVPNKEVEVGLAEEPAVVAHPKEPTQTVIKNTANADELKEKERSKIDPTIVENKMQRLTLMKSLNGRVAFFYSGKAGAKFYVFTNLAAKGSIIKLTNLNNRKYILAEVIGLLPEADRKRGYLVKLSDNARRVLGTNSKSFSGKVNY